MKLRVLFSVSQFKTIPNKLKSLIEMINVYFLIKLHFPVVPTKSAIDVLLTKLQLYIKSCFLIFRKWIFLASAFFIWKNVSVHLGA